MNAFIKEYKWLIFIASIFFMLGILRLNDLSLYTDCTRYLIWGNSVAHGKGFVDDTQPEPEYYVVNAPLFAVILTPVLALFPLSLIAAKAWTLLWGILAILLFYNWIRRYQNQSVSLAAVLFLALNPLTIVLSTEILSEAPFLCGIITVLLLIERLENVRAARWTTVLLIIVLSLIPLMREVGAALIIAVIIFLLTHKQWRLAIPIFLGVFISLALWLYRNLGIVGAPVSSQSPNLVYIFQHFVTSPDTPLIHELWQRFIVNYNAYASGLGGRILYGFPLNLIIHPSAFSIYIFSVVNNILTYAFIAFVPAIIIGIIRDIHQSKTGLLRSLFIFIYLLIILIYPVQDVRFLFPLLPFAIFFITNTIAVFIGNYNFSSHRITLACIAFITILFPNILCIYEILQTNLAYKKDPIYFSSNQATFITRYSYYSTPWKAIGEWIDQKLPDNSIIATTVKEIVPFASKCRFLELNRAVPLPLFESMIRDNAVEYLLAPVVYDSVVEYQTMINESKRFRFEKIHKISRMVIFRIYSKYEYPVYKIIQSESPTDIDNPSGLLYRGRLALLQEKYDKAQFMFDSLENRFPYISDIIYQSLIAHTFALDSIKAVQCLRRLYTSPIATSFVSAAQIHINAMNSMRRTKLISDPMLRAEKFYEISKTFWGLGYPKQAYSIIQRSIETDSTFFVGLLWAWHYGIQNGDTMGVEKHLTILESIDSENPIVKSYKRITAYHTELRKTIDRHKRSDIYLALSKEYDSLELPDEAIDESQRSIGENPNNKNAWIALGKLFEEKNSPLAYKRAFKFAAEGK